MTAAGICVTLLAAVSQADTFRLKGGQVVRGELLKERADVFVVDLGFSVISIPKDAVEQHTTASEDARAESGNDSEPTEDGAVDVPARDKPGRLYVTGKRVARGVRDAVQKFGPAVVTVGTSSGLGSGFVIDDEGHVITNSHVIQAETQISLTLFLAQNGQLERKKIEDVRIVAVDPYLDLALLQTDELKKLKVPHVFLGDSESLRVGQDAFAVGAPLGLERSVSEGILSSTSRNLSGILYLQTTAAVNPGNSGGPLFDTDGCVVGVINAKVFGAEGVGFAIPAFYLKHFLDHNEAFAYDKDNPNTGFHYLKPPGSIELEEVPAPPQATEGDADAS
jgi:serine protease Do